MAEYYLKLKKLWPSSNEAIFVGSFENKDDVTQELLQFSTKGVVELVIPGERPKDFERAVEFEILPKVAARRAGLRSPKLGDSLNTLVGTEIPGNLFSGNVKSNEVIVRAKMQEESTITETPVELKPSTNFEPRPKSTKEQKIKEAVTSEYNMPDQNVVKERVYNKVKEELYPEKQPLIVTKFASNVDWLRKQGITGEVVTYVRSPEQVEGRIVIGTLPYRLAQYAEKIGIIDLPSLRADKMGSTLSADDLDEAGAKIRWFAVREVK